MSRVTKHKRFQARASRPGGILLVVLMLIFLTSVLVSQFLASVVTQVRLTSVQYAGNEMRFAGYRLLEASLAVVHEFKLIDENGQLTSPAQGWGNPLNYAEELEWPEGMELEVVITDESGKISLNPPNSEQLKALFEEMGIGFIEADTMVDSLNDWIDDDDLERVNGAEADYYSRQGGTVKPADGPLDSLETLRYIRGFSEAFFDEETGLPNDLFRQFAQSVSLYNTGAINVNTAPAFVNQALAGVYGFDADALEDFLAGSDGRLGTDDDEYVDSTEALQQAGIYEDPDAGSPQLGFQAGTLKVESSVTFGDKRFQINALVALEGSDNGQNDASGGGSDGGADSRGNGSGETDSRNDNASENNSGGGNDFPYRILRLVENSNFD